MHSKYIDLARQSACYRDTADDLAPARGVVVGLLLSVVLWLLAVGLGTIVVAGVSHSWALWARGW